MSWQSSNHALSRWASQTQQQGKRSFARCGRAFQAQEQQQQQQQQQQKLQSVEASANIGAGLTEPFRQ